jgi:hypothetical protein
MGESVSRFEWGMFRLEQRLKTLSWNSPLVLIPSSLQQYGRVDYDWDKNQLLLTLVIYPRSSNFQKSTPTEVCGSLMRQFKFHFGMTPDSEFLRSIQGISTFFQPQYFVNTGAPKTLNEDIEAITTLQIDVMASKNDQAPFQQMMSCSSDLKKSEVRYFVTETK